MNSEKVLVFKRKVENFFCALTSTYQSCICDMMMKNMIHIRNLRIS